MSIIDSFIITVEPLNNGHIAASHFALCREVVRFSEVQNVLTIIMGKWTLKGVLYWRFHCTVCSYHGCNALDIIIIPFLVLTPSCAYLHENN